MRSKKVSGDLNVVENHSTRKINMYEVSATLCAEYYAKCFRQSSPLCSVIILIYQGEKLRFREVK